jgi:hypothetical protein
LLMQNQNSRPKFRLDVPNTIFLFVPFIKEYFHREKDNIIISSRIER